MNGTQTRSAHSRWAAFGAAAAVVLGCGGLMTAAADVSSGERGAFVPIAPCRVVDTRPTPDTVGTRTSPIGPGETLVVAIRGLHGNCDLPAAAIGISVNVAAISPTADSFLTLYPSDVTRPLTANLNVVAGQHPVSNAAVVRLGADGTIAVYNLAGTVDVAIDITGYYAAHDHDDRYYTKAEVDAKVAAAIDHVVSAEVYATGTLAHSDDATLTSTRMGEGLYWVGIERDLTGCAFVATIGSPGGGEDISGFVTVRRINGQHTLMVQTRDTVGVSTSLPFNLVVVC